MDQSTTEKDSSEATSWNTLHHMVGLLEYSICAKWKPCYNLVNLSLWIKRNASCLGILRKNSALKCCMVSFQRNKLTPVSNMFRDLLCMTRRIINTFDKVVIKAKPILGIYLYLTVWSYIDQQTSWNTHSYSSKPSFFPLSRP